MRLSRAARYEEVMGALCNSFVTKFLGRMPMSQQGEGIVRRLDIDLNGPVVIRAN